MKLNSADPNVTVSHKIFLAEDDVDDEELLREALFSSDPTATLTSFTSGIKFLRQLEETSDDDLPCLIILDYNIPELSGADILAELNKHQRYSTIPKIIWSTSDSSFYKQNCLHLGAIVYMVKPSNLAGIQQLAKSMLAYCAHHLQAKEKA